MKVRLEDPAKIIKLLTVFRHLKGVSENVNLVWDVTGLYSQGISGSHTSMFELVLGESWFKEYNVKESITMGVNCEILFKMMNCTDTSPTTAIEFGLNKKRDKLQMFIDGKYPKKFEVPLMFLDIEMLEIPEAEYQVDININSKEFSDIINELSIFGEDLTIECAMDDDDINLTSSGVNGKMEVKIKEELITEYSTDENFEKLSVVFGMEIIKSFTLFSKLNGNTWLHISPNLPLKIMFSLEDWKDKKAEDEDNEEDEKVNNFIKFYAAPKCED